MVDSLHPAREQQRLARPSRGNHDRERSGDNVIHQLEEALPADVVLGSAGTRSFARRSADGCWTRGDRTGRPMSPTSSSVARGRRYDAVQPPRRASTSKRVALHWSARLSLQPSLSWWPDSKLKRLLLPSKDSIPPGAESTTLAGWCRATRQQTTIETGRRQPCCHTGQDNQMTNLNVVMINVASRGRRTAGVGSAVAVDARV